MTFDGQTLEPQDVPRLWSQLAAVKDLMMNNGLFKGRWMTLRGIVDCLYVDYDLHASEASISARLRDLRKEKFGGHVVERERLSGGLWAYRLLVSKDVGEANGI